MDFTAKQNVQPQLNKNKEQEKKNDINNKKNVIYKINPH